MNTEMTPEQRAQIKADAHDLEGMWNHGHARGLQEGREQAQAGLGLYVQHIGNCGAVGGDPEDSRCTCGLRQIWTAT